MKTTRRISAVRAVTVCAVIGLSGCAGAPPATARVDETALRDADLDILFATEFPVASEAEALEHAATAMREGDVDKALFYLVRALQFNPKNVDILAQIGHLHLQKNDAVMAKRAFMFARNIDPAHGPTREALGLIYMDEGKTELAARELSAAVASDQTLWRAYNALGVYEDKRGNHSQARAYYDQALTIKPDAVFVLSNRGFSRYLAGDTEGAVADLKYAADDFGFASAWGNLGLVHASDGSYDVALSAYKKVMSDQVACNMTAEVAMKNGDLEVAEWLLQEAIRISPTYYAEAEENLKLVRARK